MEYFIEAQHLVKKFEQHTALNDVSISIPKGQVFGLLGPNGAGKTTSFYMTTGLVVPNEGAYFHRRFGNHEVSGLQACP